MRLATQPLSHASAAAPLSARPPPGHSWQACRGGVAAKSARTQPQLVARGASARRVAEGEWPARGIERLVPSGGADGADGALLAHRRLSRTAPREKREEAKQLARELEWPALLSNNQPDRDASRETHRRPSGPLAPRGAHQHPSELDSRAPPSRAVIPPSLDQGDAPGSRGRAGVGVRRNGAGSWRGGVTFPVGRVERLGSWLVRSPPTVLNMAAGGCGRVARPLHTHGRAVLDALLRPPRPCVCVLDTRLP